MIKLDAENQRIMSRVFNHFKGSEKLKDLDHSNRSNFRNAMIKNENGGLTHTGAIRILNMLEINYTFKIDYNGK